MSRVVILGNKYCKYCKSLLKEEPNSIILPVPPWRINATALKAIKLYTPDKVILGPFKFSPTEIRLLERIAPVQQPIAYERGRVKPKNVVPTRKAMITLPEDHRNKYSIFIGSSNVICANYYLSPSVYKGFIRHGKLFDIYCETVNFYSMRDITEEFMAAKPTLKISPLHFIPTEISAISQILDGTVYLVTSVENPYFIVITCDLEGSANPSVFKFTLKNK